MKKSTAPLNDVVADLAACLARELGMTTREEYARLDAALEVATSGWDVVRETDCFRDADGRLRDPEFLNQGDPGPRSSWVWQERKVITFPWEPRRSNLTATTSSTTSSTAAAV